MAGTITTIPNIPYKTDGIPASSSTAEETTLDTFLGANSAIYTAVNIPIGTPISRAPRVPKSDATIIGSIPNFSAEGIHLLQ